MTNRQIADNLATVTGTLIRKTLPGNRFATFNGRVIIVVNGKAAYQN